MPANYWLILWGQMDGTYKYYIGESNDGAGVCKLTFADDGSEYRHPSGKKLATVARDEAKHPTPANGRPLVKGPFTTINELKTEVDTLHGEGLILDEHHAATVLMFTQQQQGGGRKRRRKSKKKKRKSTKKKSKRNKSRRRR
jgi:hypothetical protein